MIRAEDLLVKRLAQAVSGYLRGDVGDFEKSQEALLIARAMTERQSISDLRKSFQLGFVLFGATRTSDWPGWVFRPTPSFFPRRILEKIRSDLAKEVLQINRKAARNDLASEALHASEAPHARESLRFNRREVA